MPRYRFSWDAFRDDTVSAFADAIGYNPSRTSKTPREYLEGKLKRPNDAFVKEHRDYIVDYWLRQRESTARYVYQRLVDAGVGPQYRPRTHKGYLRFIGETRRSNTFLQILKEAMWSFGDIDRAVDEPEPSFLPRFAIVDVAKAPEDARQPHDYQREAWEKMSRHLVEAESSGAFQGLLVMPTGAGKTFTAVRWLASEVLSRGQRVLWLAHRQELLEHAATAFHRAASRTAPREKLRIRIVSGRHHAATTIDPEDDVVVASVASLARRPDVRETLTTDPRTFVVVDEAHHAPAKSYRDLLKEVGGQKSHRVLGLTATPTRTLEDERPILSKLFGNRILYQVGLRSLIERGTLARPRLVRVKTGADAEHDLTEADLTHLSRFHDLSEAWLGRIAEMSERNRVIVSHYVEHRERYGPTLIFAINVHHAALLAEQLRQQGIRADYVASYRPDGTDGDPRQLIQDLRDGELDVLVNVQMVTEGVDVPGIQSVFLARPTGSEILLRQMIGRALRGPAANGTEHAYLVSFEDQWDRYNEWENPFDLVPDLQIEAARESSDSAPAEGTDAPAPDALIGAMPWDLVSQTARELRQLWTDAPTAAFEAVPHGWYVFEADGAADDEGVSRVVPVYAHQVPCWEAAFDHLWSLSDTKARSVTSSALEDYFIDCDTPRPAWSDVESAVALRSLGGVRPSFVEFGERAQCDPRGLAKRIWNEDLGARAAAELIESTYDHRLTRAVYPSLRDFQAAVDAAVYGLRNPTELMQMPKAVAVFEQGDHRILTPGPHHDLAGLMADIRAPAARMLELTALPHDGPVEWTQRILKGWYAKAWFDRPTPHGHGRIRVNRLLDSPNVPADVLRWLLWHEYLHLHLKAGHTATFRELERRWPGCVEAERFLDTLNERFGVQAW